MGLETEAGNDANIKQIKNILKGNISSVIRDFKQQMNTHAEKFEFEKAQVLKEKIAAFEKFQAKSMVVSNTIDNLDVAAFVKENDVYYINYFHVVNGAIIASKMLEIKKKLDETDSEILLYAIFEIRNSLQSNAKEFSRCITGRFDWRDWSDCTVWRGALLRTCVVGWIGFGNFVGHDFARGVDAGCALDAGD